LPGLPLCTGEGKPIGAGTSEGGGFTTAGGGFTTAGGGITTAGGGYATAGGGYATAGGRGGGYTGVAGGYVTGAVNGGVAGTVVVTIPRLYTRDLSGLYKPKNRSLPGPGFMFSLKSAKMYASTDFPGRRGVPLLAATYLSKFWL